MSVENHVALLEEETLLSVFEERAEHLSPAELQKWTVLTAKDHGTIHKLIGPGAKLLIGPRGSGKSTLLRFAYFDLVRNREALPIYVNFAKSLALEPLFHKQANALQVFRQWIAFKIVQAASLSFRDLKEEPPADLAHLAQRARRIIQQLERGIVSEAEEDSISVSRLAELLEAWALDADMKRCVLLMDDAAHAFSPEQQREFFEVFRELRSRRLAGKAAVYPGITSYSPHFHVGHEAEVLEAWYRPDEGGYLDTLRKMIERRLPDLYREQLSESQEIVNVLALASFGLPRSFLNMISQLLGVEEGPRVRPTRKRAEQAIAENAESVRGIFRSLSAKLPRFRHFVEMGSDLESAIINTLRGYNGLHTKPTSKAAVIAIEEPMAPQLVRMLGMLEYAGVVRKLGTVSRGVKGRFQRFLVHHSILISENALSLGRAYSLSDVEQALLSRNAHAFARTKGSKLLGEGFEKKCVFDLPPCTRCNAPRVSEDQHFCMRCGNELTNASVYEELLRSPIESMGLPSKKLDGILTHTPLRTVQDILLDDEQQSLRKVPHIGPVWSSRIRNLAEEYVSV